MHLKLWTEALKDLLFGCQTVCPVCRQRSCLGYWPGCQHCVESMGLGVYQIPDTPFPCFCIGSYDGRLKEHIANLKYHGAIEIGWFLGELMGIMVRETMLFEKAVGIIPLPLHPEREKKRGFNQCRLLADGIHRQWRKPILNCLLRTRPTQSQSELKGNERWRNVEGAFSLQQGYRLSGKKVIVIDDILTTGATFAGAATALTKFGAQPIGLFVASGRMDRIYSSKVLKFMKR